MKSSKETRRILHVAKKATTNPPSAAGTAGAAKPPVPSPSSSGSKDEEGISEDEKEKINENSRRSSIPDWARRKLIKLSAESKRKEAQIVEERRTKVLGKLMEKQHRIVKVDRPSEEHAGDIKFPYNQSTGTLKTTTSSDDRSTQASSSVDGVSDLNPFSEMELIKNMIQDSTEPGPVSHTSPSSTRTGIVWNPHAPLESLRTRDAEFTYENVRLNTSLNLALVQPTEGDPRPGTLRTSHTPKLTPTQRFRGLFGSSRSCKFARDVSKTLFVTDKDSVTKKTLSTVEPLKTGPSKATPSVSSMLRAPK